MENENITPDVVEETTPDVQESTEPSAEVTEEQSTEEMTQAEQEAFLNITYNKEEVKLDREKAIEYAQKGMNYDKVQEKLNSYESNAGYKWLEKYAKEKGFDDLNKFAEAAEMEERERQHQETVDSYKAKFGAEAAEAMADMQKELSELKKDSESSKAEKAKNDEYTNFIKWYDGKKDMGIFTEDFDINKIPDEIWEHRQNGMNLKEAYSEYMLNNLKTLTEQATIKKIEQNAETSTGSIKQNNTTSESGEFTREYIDSMTKGPDGRKWAMDNMDKIEKSGYFK